MELPKTDLENLAKDSWLLIYNDTLYKMGLPLKDANGLPIKEADISPDTDYIKMDDTFYFVSKRESMKTIEDMWKSDYSKELMELQNLILKTGKFETLSTVEIEKEKNELRLLDFIVNNVFRKFTFFDETPFAANRDKETGLLNESVFNPEDGNMSAIKSRIKQDFGIAESTGDDITNFVMSRRKKKQNENLPNSTPTESSLLSKVLGNENIFIMHFPQSVWSTSIGYANATQYARIDGTIINILRPSMTMNYKSVMDSYRKELKHQIEVEALQNMPFQERLMQIKTKIDQVLSSSEYKVVGLDLIKDSSNSYYITLNIPEFIMQNQSLEYFRFPSATVMMKVFMQRGVISHNPPQIREKYKHPFLRGNTENQNICTNNYSPKAANPNIDPAEEIYRKLENARQVIMSGYFSGVVPYPRDNRNSYENYKISKEEAERLDAKGDVKITNLWH